MIWSQYLYLDNPAESCLATISNFFSAYRLDGTFGMEMSSEMALSSGASGSRGKQYLFEYCLYDRINRFTATCGDLESAQSRATTTTRLFFDENKFLRLLCRIALLLFSALLADTDSALWTSASMDLSIPLRVLSPLRAADRFASGVWPVSGQSADQTYKSVLPTFAGAGAQRKE